MGLALGSSQMAWWLGRAVFFVGFKLLSATKRYLDGLVPLVMVLYEFRLILIVLTLQHGNPAMDAPASGFVI